LLQAACHHAQLLIHEATYTTEVSAKVGEFPRHSDAARVAKFAQAVSLPNLILTHFSSRYAPEGHPSPSLDDLALEARRDYHGQLFLAHDFDQFCLGTAGSVTRSATLSSPLP
jgi:ribonuclease Z